MAIKKTATEVAKLIHEAFEEELLVKDAVEKMKDLAHRLYFLSSVYDERPIGKDGMMIPLGKEDPEEDRTSRETSEFISAIGDYLSSVAREFENHQKA